MIRCEKNDKINQYKIRFNLMKLDMINKIDMIRLDRYDKIR